ncbi:TPA: hypothetical protein QHC16_004893 [Klebsiella michiganensis]|nr:hypothetical protein [Klebsiella michiganensis]HDT5951012.1 hypothetical protein [Klebsiella michiganensis]HDT5972779.1 hypothetical protein [Klebsiella michiganensis]HDT5983890.1 hypothetical protein [Klebsiella michiganensis]
MKTNITEQAQRMKAAAEKLGGAQWQTRKVFSGIEVIVKGSLEKGTGCVSFQPVAAEIADTKTARAIALFSPANVLALVEALEKAQQVPVMPLGLHPDTQKLVTDFCTALAEKLYKAQLKYGYDADWKQDGWPSQCQAHFQQHIAKGDPRDVAAYCAFMWWHGWSTKPAEGVEPRTVTVKLPDYRNTYKSPFADEVEHQVRLALELFSSAAGIKVEAE